MIKSLVVGIIIAVIGFTATFTKEYYSTQNNIVGTIDQIEEINSGYIITYTNQYGETIKILNTTDALLGKDSIYVKNLQKKYKIGEEINATVNGYEIKRIGCYPQIIY